MVRMGSPVQIRKSAPLLIVPGGECVQKPLPDFLFDGIKFGGVNMADIVGLSCTKCKNRNYVTTVNKKKQS